VRHATGRRFGWWWLTASTLALAMVSMPAAQPADPLAALRRGWQTPSPDARPMMRWWWFGPAVTPAGLDRELQAMHDAGLGGVEVQPVYPLAPDDRGRGLINHPYLSAPFLDAVRHSAATAKRLGLRYDMTLGSGWPYGGPHIPIDHAAGRLRFEKVAVKARRVPLPPMTTGETLIAVTLPDGGAELTDIKGDLVWLPDGPLPAEVWVFIAGRTGMMVKRPAAGAEGYVLDHYDRAGLQAHLDAVGAPLLDALRDTPPATIFCDSLEVFGSDWTPDLLPEFAKRRGYDLKAHLGALVAGQDARAIAVRQDWGRTLGELYEERFLAPLAEWTHARGSKLRIQGYGIPPATLSSNRLADLTDGEGAQWKTITPARWASSANHLFGRAVTASETWTWLHSPSFAATPLDLKAEADRHFLMGVNQLIGHGWPSTPDGIDHDNERFNFRFYAAGAFNDRNPWWIAMPDVSRYLQRVSALLREGRPVNDVALYLPTSDALGDIKPGTAHLLDLLRERVGTAVPGAILDAGFGFDLIDDVALAPPAAIDGAELIVGANRYRTIVLPAVRTMPAETLARLRAFSAAGGRVVAVDRLPERTPGLRGEPLPADLKVAPTPAASLGAELRKALTPDVSFEPASPDIGQHHRRAGDADVYFLANTANTPRAARLTVRSVGRVEWWDPLTGATRPADVGAVGADTMTVALDLAAYGSTVLVVARGPAPRPVRSTVAPASAPAPRAVPIAGPWAIAFADAAIAPRTRDALASWDADADTRFFSGVATYETTFELAAIARGATVTLDFGRGTAVTPNDRGPGMRTWLDAPIRDAAVVTINGQAAGAVWCPPFTLDVTALVNPGRNTLSIRVGNTALNHMAGRPLPDYRLLNLRYGERFQAQGMELVRPLPSGLVGPVQLVVTPPRRR
jgi:hypothetical protein